MSVNEIIMAVMAFFAVLGALDRIFGCRLGIGKEFEKGILTMGPLALSMIGVIVLSPVLADLLRPVIVPVYRFLGADPAMFAGTLLACDMGGGSLALALTDDVQAAYLGGVLTGSMLGVNIVFTLPVAMAMMTNADRPYAAKGMLCGILTAPIGILFGGLTAGYSVMMVLRNLTPIVLISVLIALGLVFAERVMIRGFVLFGHGVTALITVGLTASLIERITGFVIIPGMAPIEDGFLMVGDIAIVLAGALPLVYLLSRILRLPLQMLGKRMGLGEIAMAGLVASLANSIAMFGTVKDMDERGKVINMAFACSAAFVFGDHLGYTAGFAPSLIPALIVGKLIGGMSAVAVAWLLTREEKEKLQHV
jgi:ethanolamine transporter